MSEAVKTLFTDISSSYDRLNHTLSLNLDKIWRRKAIGMIARNQTENFKVLDIATGTFDLAIACLKHFSNSHVTATDFSEGMLEAGQHKIADFKKQGRIHSQFADALNLPFENEQFEVTLCSYGVRNFDDVAKGLSEMFRVLKPGGQVVILEFFKPESKLAALFHKTYANFVIPTVGRLLSGHKSAYHYLRDSIQDFYTLEEFTQIAKQQGFVNIETKSSIFDVSTAVSLKKPE